jgi:hypothetical protein
VKYVMKSSDGVMMTIKEYVQTLHVMNIKHIIKRVRVP